MTSTSKILINQGKFERVLSSFTDAVIILNGGGMLEWMNAAAEALLEVSLPSIAGSPITTLFPEGSAIYTIILHANQHGMTLTDHDVPLPTKRGEVNHVGVSVQPLMEEEERGTVVIIRDLTNLKALERFLMLDQRMAELSALAAGIAHEIKNPLGGIRGAAQLLGQEISVEMKEYTDLIISEVDRINRLVVDLIELNQPDNFPKEPTNIYPVLDDVVKLLKGIIDAKKLQVIRRYDPSFPPIVGDADRLRQIFLNIVKNAAEACDTGGKIIISTSLAWKAPRATTSGKRGRFALVEVTDDGAGLDEDTKMRLFTPFFSRKKGGSGLGLSMTLHLVQGHNGMLEIENRPEGKGVSAQVYLPFAT